MSRARRSTASSRSSWRIRTTASLPVTVGLSPYIQHNLLSDSTNSQSVLPSKPRYNPDRLPRHNPSLPAKLHRRGRRQHPRRPNRQLQPHRRLLAKHSRLTRGGGCELERVSGGYALLRFRRRLRQPEEWRQCLCPETQVATPDPSLLL